MKFLSHPFRNRIHESFALAAILAGSVALHVAWIDNFLITKSQTIAEWVTLNSDIGPISGLYIDVLGAYFTSLLIVAALWRGRDVSHWRDRVFWFFITSMVIFLLMTLPFVYGFAVV
ncbi:MAG: hypothetical protein NUV84_04075 [Candidatus Uhrbacteria bacterium]|nr:hypothetical protein [Candidatus Uhrbacteria bacterium]